MFLWSLQNNGNSLSFHPFWETCVLMKTFLLNIVFCMSVVEIYIHTKTWQEILQNRECGDLCMNQHFVCFLIQQKIKKILPGQQRLVCIVFVTLLLLLFSLVFPFLYRKPIFLMCMITFCYSMGNWLNVLRSLGWFPIFHIIKSISSYGGFSHQWKTGKYLLLVLV